MAIRESTRTPARRYLTASMLLLLAVLGSVVVHDVPEALGAPVAPGEQHRRIRTRRTSASQAARERVRRFEAVVERGRRAAGPGAGGWCRRGAEDPVREIVR